MKIFDWMHRKFHNNVDYCMVSRKKDFDPFADEGKKLSILTCERGTEALLAPLIDWQDGILAIGTFGLDHFQFEDEYSVREQENSVTGEGNMEAEEEPHPWAVKALAQELEEAFGSNNQAGVIAKEMLKFTSAVTPVVVAENSSDRGFLATEELNGEDWENKDKKKKKGERTTLADLFSAEAAVAAADKCNSDEMKIAKDSEKKKPAGRTKHVRSLAKKLVPWKGEDSRPTAKLHRLVTKMLKRKIHPELGLEIHGAIASNGTLKIEPTHGDPLLELELIDSNGAISSL